METTESRLVDAEALPLFVTRDEARLLILALQNPLLNLGTHERTLCSKVREVWKAHQGPARPLAGRSRRRLRRPRG